MNKKQIEKAKNTPGPILLRPGDIVEPDSKYTTIFDAKYHVKISKGSYGGFRYYIELSWKDSEGHNRSDSSWSLTKHGARIEAKKLIKNNEKEESNQKETVVEEYDV